MPESVAKAGIALKNDKSTASMPKVKKDQSGLKLKIRFAVMSAVFLREAFFPDPFWYPMESCAITVPPFRKTSGTHQGRPSLSSPFVMIGMLRLLAISVIGARLGTKETPWSPLPDLDLRDLPHRPRLHLGHLVVVVEVGRLRNLGLEIPGQGPHRHVAVPDRAPVESFQEVVREQTVPRRFLGSRLLVRLRRTVFWLPVSPSCPRLPLFNLGRSGPGKGSSAVLTSPCSSSIVIPIRDLFA